MSTTDTPPAHRTRTGHCLCGAISYRFDAQPEAVVVCHCGHCQRHTGSAFSVNVLVARDSLEIEGAPRSYRTTGAENGNPRDRLFCGDCGTPIFTVLHERPDLMIVKAGTLDDPTGLEPSAEVWLRRAQDWVEPGAHRARFDGDAKERRDPHGTKEQIMSFQTINPATGEFVKEFPFQSDDEVFAALDTADRLYREDWRFRPVAERARIVARAAEILRERRDEYVEYLTLEMGKVTRFGSFEVDLVADILDYYAEHGERFLAAQELPGEPGAKLITEPIGVILAIEPWNFPYYQPARVAASQLVAGNVVLMKHAESVPQSALAFARLFEEAGAPEGAYPNLFCDIDQIGRLIDDFRVRGVTLTGSERAGASVGERAGRNLKKAVLELGGSDPALILEGAPLDHAVEQVVRGRTYNSGQGCVNIKRVIVVGRDRGEQMLAALEERFAAIKVGDPKDEETQVGPLSSERALEGLLRQIREAEEAGGRIVHGGHRVDRPGFYLEPTIITDITEDNPLFHEEAFGPVLSFYVVDSEDEAIRLANATRFGLGGYVFDADVEHAQQVAARVEAGMVYINSCFADSPSLPFGGVKNSGFGRELAELGIGEFLNRKLVRIAQ